MTPDHAAATTADTGGAPASAPPLALLGITPAEETIYRALLRAPGSTVQALSEALPFTPAAVAEAVAELERKGFATHAPEQVPRLFPSPPDIAVEALLRRQQELQLARLAIADLQREKHSSADGNPVVEIIDADPAAQVQPYAQSHQRAVREELCLVRRPSWSRRPTRASTHAPRRANAACATGTRAPRHAGPAGLARRAERRHRGR